MYGGGNTINLMCGMDETLVKSQFKGIVRVNVLVNGTCEVGVKSGAQCINHGFEYDACFLRKSIAFQCWDDVAFREGMLQDAFPFLSDMNAVDQSPSSF